jgi:hypothetical protein
VQVTGYTMGVQVNESNKRDLTGDPENNIKYRVCILIYSCLPNAVNYNF